MRNVTADTITDAVLGTMSDNTQPRLKEIMTSLIRHLHAFAREVELTPDEWMAAIEFLVRVGETTKTDRNEFILGSDTLGVSALVDLLHNRDNGGTTTSSLLGPFYINGERMQPLEVGGDLIGDNEGEPVVVAGRVTTPQGAPIAGACGAGTSHQVENHDHDKETDLGRVCGRRRLRRRLRTGGLRGQLEGMRRQALGGRGGNGHPDGQHLVAARDLG